MRRLGFLSALAAATLLVAGCEPKLDDDAPRLSKPSSLPHLDAKPVAPSVAERALVRAAAGTSSLAAGDIEAARTALTEACTLDPSLASARLNLARAYASAGLGSVALDLLESMVARSGDCGTCVASLMTLAANDPLLAHVLSHSRGEAVLEAASTMTLPWQRWASESAAALQAFRPDVLETFVHSDVPFVLARSCPQCPNSERRGVEQRPLRGSLLLIKVASRFDTRNPMLGGIALGVAGTPTCSDACCSFVVPETLEPATAQLEQLCFRPLTPTASALTQLKIRYAPSRAPAPTPAQRDAAEPAPRAQAQPLQAAPAQPVPTESGASGAPVEAPR